MNERPGSQEFETKFPDIIGQVNEAAIEQAQDTYRKSQPRHSHERRADIKAGELHSYTIPHAVLQKAIELAGGDLSRLELNKDGSVTVHNHPRGKKHS